MQNNQSIEKEQAKIDETKKIQAIAKIPVIDMEFAMFNVANNAALLLNLLHNFVKDYQGANTQVMVALESGNTEFATYKLHTLKGITGTLGAKKLSHVIEILEKRLKQQLIQQQSGSLETEQFAFNQEFNDLMSALEDAGLAPSSESKRNVKVNLSEIDLNLNSVLEITHRLQRHLELGSTAATEELDTLIAELQGANGNIIAELIDSVDNYDFDDALIALEKLQKQLRDFK